MSDGSRTNILVPLRELMQNLESSSMMLPSDSKYQETYTSRMSAVHIEKICDVNSHGSEEQGDRSVIFPAVCMMNHSSDANATFVTSKVGEMDKIATITTSRRIKIGEEICLMYHPDDDVVRRKWGISS